MSNDAGLVDTIALTNALVTGKLDNLSPEQQRFIVGVAMEAESKRPAEDRIEAAAPSEDIAKPAKRPRGRPRKHPLLPPTKPPGEAKTLVGRQKKIPLPADSLESEDSSSRPARAAKRARAAAQGTQSKMHQFFTNAALHIIKEDIKSRKWSTPQILEAKLELLDFHRNRIVAKECHDYARRWNTDKGCAEDETFIRASNHRAFLRAIRAAKPELYRDEMPTGSRYNVEAGPSVLFRVVLEDHFSNPPAPKSLERGLTNLAKFAKALENHAVGFNTAHHGTSTMVIAKADHEQFISEVKRHRDWSTMWERTTRESSSVQGSESDDESGSSESSDLSSLSVSLLDD